MITMTRDKFNCLSPQTTNFFYLFSSSIDYYKRCQHYYHIKVFVLLNLLSKLFSFHHFNAKSYKLLIILKLYSFLIFYSGHQPNKLSGEIGPVDTLIDRNQQWKHVTKSLKAYYEGLAHISNQTSKEVLALADTAIQVPLVVSLPLIYNILIRDKEMKANVRVLAIDFTKEINLLTTE